MMGEENIFHSALGEDPTIFFPISITINLLITINNFSDASSRRPYISSPLYSWRLAWVALAVPHIPYKISSWPNRPVLPPGFRQLPADCPASTPAYSHSPPRDPCSHPYKVFSKW